MSWSIIAGLNASSVGLINKMLGYLRNGVKNILSWLGFSKIGEGWRIHVWNINTFWWKRTNESINTTITNRTNRREIRPIGESMALINFFHWLFNPNFNLKNKQREAIKSYPYLYLFRLSSELLPNITVAAPKYSDIGYSFVWTFIYTCTLILQDSPNSVTPIAHHFCHTSFNNAWSARLTIFLVKFIIHTYNSCTIQVFDNFYPHVTLRVVTWAFQTVRSLGLSVSPFMRR